MLAYRQVVAINIQETSLYTGPNFFGNALGLICIVSSEPTDERLKCVLAKIMVE